MYIAVPDSVPNPSTAAIKAITKNVSAQLNMMHLSLSEFQSVLDPCLAPAARVGQKARADILTGEKRN
jgi:hypothetical protein